jgi:hypothetical protein
MQDSEVTAVARQLRDAAAAHAEYEKKVLGGVRDEDWPAWYAAYLLDHGLKDALPAADPHDVNRLAATLTQLDVDYRSEQPGEEWPDFYARRMVAGP